MASIKIFRVRLQRFFRRTGLLGFVERLRYYQKSIAYAGSNRKFIKENPDFVLPPSRLAYDAYNAPKWKFYKKSGEEMAEFIRNEMDKHVRKSNNTISIYEWGCGPARII